MTIKIQIPFLVNLTEEQKKEIKDDIDERIEGMNQKLDLDVEGWSTHFKLEYYNINILVGLEEVENKR